jgi:signal transduction histidine kinase
MLWLGSRLLQQDHRLEAQYRQESHEQAADRAVRSLQLAISDPALFKAPPAAGAVLIQYPGGPALFQSSPSSLAEVPSDTFREGEGIENREGDLTRAAAVYRRLTGAEKRAERAGAWLRLARTLRKSRQFTEALAAYGELEQFGNVGAAGWPATLAAVWGRCSVLEDQRRAEDLSKCAASLRQRLDAGEWPLSRDTYDIFAEDAERWSGIQRPRETEMLTAAANNIWERVHRGDEPAEGRRFLALSDGWATLIWKPVPKGTAVFAASNSFVKRNWLDSGTLVWLGDETGRLLEAPLARDSVVRYPAETRLPWTLAVAAPVVSDGFIARRRALLALLSLVALFTLAGSYFCLRTLRREFALARMQSDFVSAVSHEFRTPLTSMRLITEALVDARIPDPQRLGDSYESLARATQRLHRLVEDLLDFRRMESGAVEFHMQSMNASLAVLSVAEEFRKEVVEHGFTIRVNAEAAARIRADESAFSRALWNLLDNAAKYSGYCRDIEVSLKRDGANMCVSVADGGIGIAPEDRGRLFTKFYRGAEARRSGIPGTGIGLAMVAQIAAAHGGGVSVVSEPGRGSTFTMSLPLEED